MILYYKIVWVGGGEVWKNQNIPYKTVNNKIQLPKTLVAMHKYMHTCRANVFCRISLPRLVTLEQQGKGWYILPQARNNSKSTHTHMFHFPPRRSNRRNMGTSNIFYHRRLNNSYQQVKQIYIYIYICMQSSCLLYWHLSFTQCIYWASRSVCINERK